MNEYAAHVLDQLQPIGMIHTTPYFGGIAFRMHGRQFAFIMRDTLYLAVTKDTRDKYAAAGSQPFTYTTKNGVVQVRRYFEVPAAVLENSDVLRDWAQEASATRDDTKA